MKFTEIASRLTGISCPVFGVSWNPPEPERLVARRAVTFLEDRRVLYAPFDWEAPRYCATSIIEIRRYLTSELQGLEAGSELAKIMRAMRAACRKFLNSTIGDDDDPGMTKRHRRQGPWDFQDALGELRGVFGVHVAQLAARYGLDVEDDLAQIVPGEDREDRTEQPRPQRDGREAGPRSRRKREGA